MKGCKVTKADAVKAYLQAFLKSLHATWVRLPREVWPASWFGPDGKPLYHRPVVLLLKSLYGHPEAGSHWQKHLEEQLLKMGGQKAPEFPSTFTFPGYGGLALVIYVDDFVLSGKAEWHDQFWAALSKLVQVDDVGSFLGRHHSTIKVDEQELRVTTWLATKIQKWCSSCDVAIFRAVCYIDSTKGHLLTGYVNDESEDVFVEFFVDTALCGNSEDCCSTSGAWIQLSWNIFPAMLE